MRPLSPLRLLAVAALAASTLPKPVAAQLPRPRLEISPYAGALLPRGLDTQTIDGAPILGLRAGVRLPGGVAVEGQLGYAPLSSRLEPPAGSVRTYDLSLWLLEAGLAFAVPLPGPVTPFLGISAGKARFDPDLAVDGRDVGAESEVVLSAGAGVRLSLGGVSLRADVRDHLVLDALEEVNGALAPGRDGETMQALEGSVGLSFLF